MKYHKLRSHTMRFFQIMPYSECLMRYIISKWKQKQQKNFIIFLLFGEFSTKLKIRRNYCIRVQFPVLIIHPLTMHGSDRLLIGMYLILQLSQSGIPIWRAWVCRDTRKACRWFQIRVLAASAPGAGWLPAQGQSSGSDGSEAWGWAWSRGQGSAGSGAGRVWGPWWSEAPEGSLAGRRQWLYGEANVQ